MKASELINYIEQTGQLYLEETRSNNIHQLGRPDTMRTDGMEKMFDHIVESLKIFCEVTGEQ